MYKYVPMAHKFFRLMEFTICTKYYSQWEMNQCLLWRNFWVFLEGGGRPKINTCETESVLIKQHIEKL